MQALKKILIQEIIRLLQANNPNLPVHRVLSRLYPYKSFLTKDGQNMVEDLMKNLSIPRDNPENGLTAETGVKPLAGDYVPNSYHDSIIAALEESIRVHDVCLIGPRGSGKSTLIKQLADRLSLEIEPIMLYQVR